jgi:hypothetical protein
MELAKLIGSDSFSEVVEIARIERGHRQEQEQQKFQQDQQLEQQRAQNADALKQKELEFNEASKERDRETQIERERIQALGRAANLKEDPESMNVINQQANLALKDNELTHKMELEAGKLKQREQENTKAFELKLKELELKAKEIEAKAQDRQSREYVASINKN